MPERPRPAKEPASGKERRFGTIDPPPVFIGGTGRSGTTVTGRLLGQHPKYAVIPIEAKFHAIREGLPGVVRRRTTPEAFAERLRGDLFRGAGDRRGLSAITDEGALEREVALFLTEAADDPVRASRRLTHRLFNRFARREGKQGWVEMTPRNVMHANDLIRIFPELKMIHTVRDGRDVVSSLVGLGWIDDPFEALEWWEARVLHAHRMTKTLPEGSVHVLYFERFLATDRERSYAELLAFLGWEDEEPVRRFYDESMATANANIGRWAVKLPAADRDRVDGLYTESLARLREAGAPTPTDDPPVVPAG